MLGDATFWFCTCVKFMAAGLDIVVEMFPVTLIGELTVEIATLTGEVFKVTFCGDAPLNGVTPSGEFTVVLKLPVTFSGELTVDIATLTGDDMVTFCGEAPLNGITPSGELTVVLKLPVTFNGDGVVTLMGEEPAAMPTETGDGWLTTATPAGLATLPTVTLGGDTPGVVRVLTVPATVTLSGVGPAIPTDMGEAGNVTCKGVGVVTATLLTTATPAGLATLPTVTLGGDEAIFTAIGDDTVVLRFPVTLIGLEPADMPTDIGDAGKVTPSGVGGVTDTLLVTATLCGLG